MEDVSELEWYLDNSEERERAGAAETGLQTNGGSQSATQEDSDWGEGEQ